MCYIMKYTNTHLPTDSDSDIIYLIHNENITGLFISNNLDRGDLDYDH